jgi:hypothetical protein
MKKLLIISLALPLLWCGGSDSGSNRTSQPPPRTKATEVAQQTPAPTEKKSESKKPDLPKIKEVKFTSPARTSIDLELSVTLEVPDNETLFDYRWFANDEEILDAKTNVLPSRFFKSGDWIHCRIKAIRGEHESGMTKSKHIMIQGRPPVLELDPVEAFEVPGRFQYQIKATDPDADEIMDLESALTYELVSPKDAGITLDPRTGLINWDLTEEIVNRLGPKIDIKFKVTKKGAPSAGSSITLNFSPPGE